MAFITLLIVVCVTNYGSQSVAANTSHLKIETEKPAMEMKLSQQSITAIRTGCTNPVLPSPSGCNQNPYRRVHF
jgi:hypothetical protein